jgi:colanic acid/amylovoran biosynthesis glycosyltransferase
MRIAFLVNEFPKISETFVLDQITFLLDRGCEVDIYAQRLYANEELVHRDVLAYSLMGKTRSFAAPRASKPIRVARALFDVGSAFPRHPRLVARALDFRKFGLDALKFRRFYLASPFLDRAPYDIVHCHFGPIGEVGAELRRLGIFDAPLLTQFHGFDVSSYVRERGEGAYRALFAEGDVFLCVSGRIRERLVQLGCASSKTRIHHTGVKAAAIPFEPRTPVLNGPINILTVGRLVEKKGIEYGLRALALLSNELPSVHYTIVGDGPEERTLADLARTLRIEDKVTFAGACTREEVSVLMGSSHVLLAPSVNISRCFWPLGARKGSGRACRAHTVLGRPSTGGGRLRASCASDHRVRLRRRKIERGATAALQVRDCRVSTRTSTVPAAI